MFDLHPDHAHYLVQTRQEIVQQGVNAARRPGDLAALRERIGQLLIEAGEQVRGRHPRATQIAVPSARVTQMAR